MLCRPRPHTGNSGLSEVSPQEPEILVEFPCQWGEKVRGDGIAQIARLLHGSIQGVGRK
jgi:hypothetical protein